MKSIPAQTAAAIRKELKKAFPAIEFSVMSQSYTGGSSVRISYTDGIKTARVQAIVDKYSYETKRDESIPQTRYVFVSREMSVDTCVAIGAELGIAENEIAHPIERFGGEYGTAVIRRVFCDREFGPHAGHPVPYPVTDADFGRIPNAPTDGADLLAGRWIDGDASVVLVTDHPEADAIDAAFNGCKTVAMYPDAEARTFRVDDEVLYSPRHVRFEPSTQNQFGVVTSVVGEFPAQKIWVRFNGPGGELTPVDCLIKKNTTFVEVETQPDGQGRQRFFLYWPADNVGESVNLAGLRSQIFNAQLAEHLDRARRDGHHVVEWKNRWF